MDSLNQSLAAEREERERVEREREGVRGEVEKEKRGKEEAEEKVEEMKKTLVEKNDDVQAKTKMIAKVSIHFFTYQPIAYLSLFGGREACKHLQLCRKVFYIVLLCRFKEVLFEFFSIVSFI